MNFITYFEKINLEEWRSLLSNSYFSSPFQTPNYYQVLKDTKGFDVEAFGLIVSGELRVLMLITIIKELGLWGYFSRRGIVFGGPLLYKIEENELEFFLKMVQKELSGKIIYLETRNFFDYSAFRIAFNNAGWSYEPYLNYQLSLENIRKENILSLFKYNRQREVKQSLFNGATYQICKNEDEISEIYKILKNLYRTRVKLPLPSLDFFLGLFRNNIIKAFIVRHNNKTIGGSFCPVLPGKAIYTFYYCGLRNYHKRIFPTHLAVLAAIEYAIDNKITMMDFMGAGKPDINYGVRKYKSEFGGTLVEHGRFIKVLNPLLFKVGKLGLNLMSKFN